MAAAAGMPTLSMLDITKHYNAIAALRDVSFEVLPGEVHALLGENGAGKSTLMNVASGTTAPDGGTIVFDGKLVDSLTPALAQDLGIAIVHQHPALLPDMTVAENILVAVAREHLQRRDPDVVKAMRSLLDDVHFLGHLEDRVSSLSVARRHLLELAKAFAVSPRLLILDEPTAPLSQDSVELLFTAVRKLAADGTAVVYITHRLGEVREIADRVTVLRDGALRGTSAVREISDADLLAMIIGRTLETTFPPKHTPVPDEAPLLRVEGLSGDGFDDISFSARKGEIVGVAGVVGNGQPALLRALAGRESATGSVNVDGQAALTAEAARERGLHAGRPADRRLDGRAQRAREHRDDRARPAHDRPLHEHAARGGRRRARALRAGGQGALARGAGLGALGRQPAEGRDGARDALRARDPRRRRADAGRRRRRARRDLPHPARGRRPRSAGRRRLQRRHRARGAVRPRDRDVARPGGRDARGRRRHRGAHRARRDQRDHAQRRAGWCDAQRGLSRLARFIEGDYAPVLVLALVMLVLGLYVLHHNSRYTSDFNINSVMFACAALGFISLGQTFALLLGGIDLSVGPLAGFLVVVGSFFILDGKSPAIWVLGFGLMLACAVGVGLLNGALIRYAKFTAVAATLVTYIGLGGLSFTLRSAPDGYIAASVTSAIATKVGPVPVAFIVFVACALGLELALRKSRFGLRMRAVGSDEESARRVGVPVNRTALLGYLGASLLTLLGAVVLLAQLGVGDPGQGTGYTLTSITAVVLGGTSLLGGRGTFIGTLMGAGLSVQVLNATVFLGLDQKWQYIFQGLLIVAAALIYSQVRRTGPRTAAAR